MSIAATSQTIRDLLETQLRAEGHLGNYSVSIISPSEVHSGFENRVGLVLYRVGEDAALRTVSSAGATTLQLRYLLVVWGQRSALGEQVMLGHCMDILRRHAVIAGSLLSEAFSWEPGEAIGLTVEPLATDELMRIWAAMKATYQLSVGYVARTIRQTSPV